MSCSTCGSHGYICQQPIRHCFVLLFQCPHLEKSLCTLGTPRIGFPTLNWLTYLSLFFLFLLRLCVVTLQWHGTFMEYSHSRKHGVLLKWVLTKWTSQSRFIKGLNTPWTMKLSHGLVRALSGYWIRPRITLVNIKGNMSKSDHGGRGVQKTYFKVYIITRRSLHCQVEHHVQTKFATPILHAIDNFNIYGIFLYIYITIDSIFCIFVFWNFSHLHFFVVIFLVQFCFILARNGMFYNKKRIIKFSYHSLLCNRYRVYTHDKKKLIKNWPILVMLPPIPPNNVGQSPCKYVDIT